jgi:hypothetical protein
MNVLNTILSKVIPWAVKPEQAAAKEAPPVKPAGPQTQRAAPAATAAPSTTAAPAAPRQNINVEEVLRGMETRSSQKLDWQHSIVDLMKMLDMNSDLASRKQLAKELNYTGDMSDSATMNIWLHKQVMKKFEENGGKIPATMK